MPDRSKKALDRLSDYRVQLSAAEYLSFALADEPYAIELSRIHSIIMVPELTEVPRAPSYVLGVCSVRGVLATVLDLRRRMALQEAPVGRHTRILMTQTPESETIGLLVDAVRYVVRPEAAEIEPTQMVLGSEVSEHVLGIARVSLSKEEKKRKKAFGNRSAGAASIPAGPREPATNARETKLDNEKFEVIVLLDLDSVCGRAKGEGHR